MEITYDPLVDIQDTNFRKDFACEAETAGARHLFALESYRRSARDTQLLNDADEEMSQGDVYHRTVDAWVTLKLEGTSLSRCPVMGIAAPTRLSDLLRRRLEVVRYLLKLTQKTVCLCFRHDKTF